MINSDECMCKFWPHQYVVLTEEEKQVAISQAKLFSPWIKENQLMIDKVGVVDAIMSKRRG